jgi:hypothetical protein
MLTVVHRFFGEPGLRVIQDAYAGAGDAAVLQLLSERVDSDDPVLSADPETLAKIKFLVASPGDYVPCEARRTMKAASRDPVR